MQKIIFILCFLGGLLFQCSFYAQTQNLGVSLTPQIGFLVQHRATMAHLNEGHSYGGQISAIIQTDGSKQWHHDFNFPKIEMKALFYDLGNPEVLGKTFGVYSGLFLPYFKEKGWSLGNALHLGISYVTKRYDLEGNPKNNAIGSHLNASANIGLRLEKQFKNNAIGIGVSMAHLSNGAYKLPNLGLNLPFLGVSYVHYFKPLKFKDEPSEIDQMRSLYSWSFHSQIIGSFKQIYPTGGSTYGVAGLINYVQVKTGVKCILEAGLDGIYNQSIIVYNGEGHGKDKNFQLGLYGAYVLPIHKIEILIAMGRYVYNPLDPGGMWFHKLGGRFKITDRLSGVFAIKAHWAKADYFEYGLSYRWK